MTGKIKPVVYEWSGNEMVPLQRFKRQCDAQYLVGEHYVLTVVEARSRASHNFYFATLHDAWENLPEEIAPRYPSPEHLRAQALVQTGWATERNFPCTSHEHATQLASYIRTTSTYAVIRVHGDVVQIFEPMSQSAKAMGKDQFEKSKRDVLEWVAGLIDTKVSTLKKQGNQRFPEKAR